MKKLKILLIVSLLFNVIFIFGSVFVIHQKGGLHFLKNQLDSVSSTQEYPNYYLQKKDIFEATNQRNVEKVFIGDSITDHGEFQEHFPGEVVLNRGISGDNAKGVLNRIEEVVQRKPAEVYLMIGVNDIPSNQIEDYEENVRSIVQAFSKDETKVFLQSILPVNNDIYGNAISNGNIFSFNEVLKVIASETGADYLDLNSNFVDSDGQLKKEFTIDGIHLTGAGYEEWMKHINQ